MGHIKNILNESNVSDNVTDAIKKRYEMKIKYAGDKNGKGGGERLIQPVAYGLSKAGNPVVRAFQPFGDTKTKVPHWKMFRLDRIEEVTPLKNRHFKEPPSDQWGVQGKFNPNGDSDMSEVYAIADFNGASDRYENSGLKRYNDAVHAQKVAENPYYDLKKNIERAKKMGTPDYVKRNVEEYLRNKKKREERKNQQSAKEMASVQNFGDADTQQTNGPIYKNDTTQQITGSEEQTQLNYDNVANNGPVYKDQNNGNDKLNGNDNNEEELDNEENGSR